ncbi:MAG: DUF99 family protein [Candidatus Marsarchaeota archaeon]|nr:DUF99 family protein [Candidatus Marsarchaeota archaeon]
MALLKDGIRIASFCSGPVSERKRTALFCIITRKDTVEGMLSSDVEIDGFDGEKKILHTLRRSRFASQVGLIALNGVALAGLNVVDIAKLSKSAGIPAVAVTRKAPGRSMMEAAIRKHCKGDVKAAEAKIMALRSAGTFHRVGGFYVCSSASASEIKHLVAPAAAGLRIAHMAARACSTGESAGRL